MPLHSQHLLFNDHETVFITTSSPGTALGHGLHDVHGALKTSTTTPVIGIGITPFPSPQSSMSWLEASQTSCSTVTLPHIPQAASRDHSTGHVFELSPAQVSSFSPWSVEILYSLRTRGIWNGSDTSAWCLKEVCEKNTVPFDVLCRQNYTKHRDKFEQWSCDYCYPSRNVSFLDRHCHTVGERSALILHVAVGLLVAWAILTLIVGSITILRFLVHEPVATVKRWCQKSRQVTRDAKHDAEGPDLSKPGRKRLRKRTGLVPIMPPAHSLYTSGRLKDQVDGNAPDVELGLMQKTTRHPTHFTTRAASSGTESRQKRVASRRQPSSLDTHGHENVT